jgi:hypothetical protein
MATRLIVGGDIQYIFYILSVVLASLASFSSGIHAANFPFQKILSEREVTYLIPARVRDRDGWSRDILRTFSNQNLPVTADNVCAVKAVIQQESGFDPKPKTKNMMHVTKRAMKEKFGVVGAAGIRTALDAKQDSERKISYWKRIEKAKSEYDVDQVLQDFSANYGVAEIYLKYDFFTTAGSMQVSVSFVSDQAKFHGATQDLEALKIREFLYTRYGGIYFGTLRLLGYPAGYDKLIYRFADYNVGMYASRNVAVQQQVARLTGHRLALDGDLLRYDKNGVAVKEAGESERAIVETVRLYAPNLDSRVIRNDLLLEKTIAFENTGTYLAIKRAYQAKYGAAPYARLPEVKIKSPKITSKFTTAQFATRVNSRYLLCLKQALKDKPEFVSF